MRGLLHGGLVTAAAVACLLLGAPSAFAAGGADIAAAPNVAFAQPESGDTSTDSTAAQNLCGGAEQNSWWLLPVIAGDSVTINYEGAGAEDETLYPVGTDDSNVANAQSAQHSELGSNGAQQGTYIAPSDGSMPLDFSTYDCDFGPSGTPGPYDFTASVRHAVVLGVPSETSLPLGGVLAVGVHNPDGAAITDPSLSLVLQLQSTGQPWVTIGSATDGAGTAGIRYRISSTLAGRKVEIRVTASGSAYVTETSATQSVTLPTLTPLPGPVRCITPRLKGLKLGAAETKLRRAHCAVGRIRRPRHVRKHHVLRVGKQSPAAGTHHRSGYRVGVTLG
jgi:hypothetical protein